LPQRSEAPLPNLFGPLRLGTPLPDPRLLLPLTNIDLLKRVSSVEK